MIGISLKGSMQYRRCPGVAVSMDLGTKELCCEVADVNEHCDSGRFYDGGSLHEPPREMKRNLFLTNTGVLRGDDFGLGQIQTLLCRW